MKREDSIVTKSGAGLTIIRAGAGSPGARAHRSYTALKTQEIHPVSQAHTQCKSNRNSLPSAPEPGSVGGSSSGNGASNNRTKSRTHIHNLIPTFLGQQPMDVS